MPSHVEEHVAVVETEAFKSPNTRRLYDYITEKRGGRERPALADIDLMEIYDIAPSMCIRDVIGDGTDLKCRFWGSEFEWAYQTNCTGKLVSETYSPEGIENTLELHHRALAATRPLRLIGNLGYIGEKIDHVTFEGIMICVDGKDFAKQHVLSVGQFDYTLDDEDRAFFLAQTGKSFA